MINIRDALYNILHSRYGRDVRQSIHDGIYQINENANEAIDLAQIKFGTAVNSPTDPITGYTENSLYLNVNTGIMWKLEGGLWVKKGTFKSIDNISLSSTSGTIDTYKITFTDGSVSNFNVTNGTDGADGKSITGITKTSTSGKVDHYDVNLSDGTTISGFDVTNGADGADGKSIANIALASTSGNVKNYDVFLDDGTKMPTGFSVEDGKSSYVYIRYSANFDGTGMVTVPTDATVYIGIVVTSQSVAPTDPSVYSWVRFIGKSGTGSGDMLASDYSTKYAGVVDKAAALYDGTNEILANQLMDKTVYDADNNGIVDEATHATNADKVGNAITAVLEKLADVSGQLNYNGNPVGSDYINSVSNEFSVINKKLSLASSIITKLSKLNSDGTLNFSNVKSKPTTLSGYGITDAYTKSNTYSKTEVDNKLDSWHKYNGAIEENTVNTINTDETITFRNIDTSKAYELWFDTSDGQQATVKSSSILGTDITYTVNTPTAGTKFRLLVKGI